MYAEVLVEYGVKSLDRTFTYIVPNFLVPKIQVGMKVVVPFGAKKINGFIVGLKSEFQSDYELKEIIEITDEYLKLNEELLAIGQFVKDSTLCSLITAYQTMLPSSLKVKTNTTNYQKYDVYVVLNKSEDEIVAYINHNRRRKRQIEILNILLNDHRVLKTNVAGSSLDVLLKLELVVLEKKEKYRIDYGYVENPVKPELTEEQIAAVAKIKASFNNQNIFLLHGVTGSGKTEIYMTLIEEVLKNNQTAIMLVPEISLTTQIVKKFYERFGNLVAIFHSALSEGEKYDEYLKILKKEVKIVVGTRSSIFTPMQNLGIIIIDEEHSENYKQENNPRYSAVDVALFRSEHNNIPLVLGSATPLMETMARAKKGLYELIEIKKRIGTSVLPDVTLVDMAIEMRKRNMVFSDLLKNKIKDRLLKKEQTILLLNRRGFSTTITCQNCGFIYKCPHCDITLTFHKTSNNLRCHYCGYTKYKETICPECKEKALNFFGLGTEKLESELKSLFPEAKVVRMDADTTRNKGSHAQILDDFHSEKYDILLGTQMIAKGLDFPKVTLVGVINGDTSLNIPDFRSSERTFELLNQVAGRAGRGTRKGEVVIQTFNPDNYTLNCIKNNDYETFYNYEMNIRRKLGYPPYYYLSTIKVVSKDYELVSKESRKIGDYLKRNLSDEFIILGPTIANMFKVNNYYRFQLMIKYKQQKNLFKVLKNLDELYATNKNINLEIDISPNRV